MFPKIINIYSICKIDLRYNTMHLYIKIDKKGLHFEQR
jgi:hypothetical protein